MPPPAAASGQDPDPGFAIRLTTDPPPSSMLGGKGAALARLVIAGYPVPATAVITTASYRSVADQPPIIAVTDRIAAGEGVTVAEIDAAFSTVAIPEPVAAEIVATTEAVGGGGPVAVRSSATVEDMHGSSFAGQYRSVLDVDSSDSSAVLEAVRHVWASLWYPAPSAYRRAFGIDQSNVAMAVVVMQMIPATTAGVVFTADPGGSDGARVEAVDGLGESLVSGRRTPSAWVVAAGDEPSTVESPLPAAPATALQIANDIADRFGAPQDVEWAAIDGEVYIVQSRPITVLEESDGFDTDIDDHELTTAGIVELVPGVLPPLRWELNRFLLEEAFRSVLDNLGIIRGRAVEDRPFVRRVRGRAAIDFDQLRDAAANIPGAVDELEQQYFGTGDQPPVEGVRRSRLRLADLKQDLRTLQTGRKVVEQADVVIRATRRLRGRHPVVTDMTDRELVRYSLRLVDTAARGLAAELGVAAAGAAAYHRLELQLAKHLGPQEAVRRVQVLTARSGTAIERSPSASAAVFAGPTWAELGSAPPVPPPDIESYTDDRRQELKQELRSLPGWTRRRVLTGGFVDVRLRLINRLLSDVIDHLRRRELTKAAFLELGGDVRRVHLELGGRLVERGLLSEPADIELLASTEITDAGHGRFGLTPDVIRRRRNWLSRYEVEGALPIRFTGVPEREELPLPEGDVLNGWAASPGRRRGRARVVTGSDGAILPGEVLVAEATDASWSPLFMKAAAIVVERGGPLSHAAILARELGLPAVLNVTGAARVLDGCTVSVDGDQGAVVIESRGPSS